MQVKMILPALTEALSPYFRPLKYSLFPPLGLATLAGYFGADDQIDLQDEHIEKLNLDDEPDLVVIEVYITSSRRAYEIADHYRGKGSYVCLGGLHVTALPDEAALHADSIFLGPGEDTWPRFLEDFRGGQAKPLYQSRHRSLRNCRAIRRDLVKSYHYLIPNTIVVSRGCPHHCDFCYKQSFFRGGKSFYTMGVEQALGQIDALGGRHLFFLDDHLFADTRFARDLFEGMRGMGRLWQGAATVESVLRTDLVSRAAACGLRSVFIGFETLNSGGLRRVGKLHNLGYDYDLAIRRLRDHGVMINASFVFGFDGDGPDIFNRTVDWAVQRGLETATFHILTPYPGTALYERLRRQGRISTTNWQRYDTRHAVFRPTGMSVSELEAGYRGAYERFYQWSNVLKAAATESGLREQVRHLLYKGGWKKLEPFWNVIVKLGLLPRMIPLLESILGGFGKYSLARQQNASAPPLSGEDLGKWGLPRAAGLPRIRLRMDGCPSPRYR